MKKQEIVPFDPEILKKFEPTAIIKIAVNELTAPVEAAAEMNKLLTVIKSIFLDHVQQAEWDDDSEKWRHHPDTLNWAKELRMIIKDYNDMTKGVQEKAMLKQIDVIGEIYKSMVKNAKQEDIINLVRKLDKNAGT